MDNTILQLLGITDSDLQIVGQTIKNDERIVVLQKKLVPVYCPECGARMYSRGIYVRTINHPVIQGIGHLTLKVRERKWRCPSCRHMETDHFHFLEPYKQSTSLTPLMIINEMKDINMSAAEVARQYNVSNTYVHTVFMQYVSLPRLPLTDIISVDEVYMAFNHQDRYAMVIMDFRTGQIIDILPNRNKETTEEYFRSISKTERYGVKYIVSDMYNPYLNYPRTFFPNAVSIVDSFHVVQWINRKIISYINHVKKRYQKRDLKKLEEENRKTNRDYQTRKDSREVYILKNFRWVLLEDVDHIHYSYKRIYSKRLNEHLDTYQRENIFMSLDDSFPLIRSEKEKYIEFNQTYVGKPEEADPALAALIKEYRQSTLKMFREFADLLSTYAKPITASFTTISKKNVDQEKDVIIRLSNGPMESFNNKPKDYKKESNGVKNFEYTRNRILWATRQSPSILAVPKEEKEVHTYTGAKRGSYRKHN